MPPWQGGKPTEVEARMLAAMRSAIHESQSWTTQKQRRQPGAGQPCPADPSRWAHRKAEWLCKQCSAPNMLHRPACRTCGEVWSVGCKTLPAGSPPPPRTTQERTSTQPSGAPPKSTPPGPWGGPKTPEAIRKAEAALQAASEAEVGEEVLQKLRENVTRLKQAETEKQPLAKRLQQASHQATIAEAAYAKAQERLLAATKAAAEAEANLNAARTTVDAVTAELTKAAPTGAAQTPDAKQLLSDLLNAVKTAAAKQGAEGSREALEKAAAAAEAVTVQEDAKTAPSECANSQPKATGGEEVDAEMRGKRWRLSDAEADALLQELAAEQDQTHKRQRLQEACRAHEIPATQGSD